MRTIINLPDEQVEQLAKICDRNGFSRAEAVRRAVALYVDAQSPQQPEDVFGIWRNRGLDGLAHQLELRREWP